jgi:hypothetical protein
VAAAALCDMTKAKRTPKKIVYAKRTRATPADPALTAVAATESSLPRVKKRSLAVFAVSIALLLAPIPACGRAFTPVFSGFGNMVMAFTGNARLRDFHFVPARLGVPGADEWSVALASVSGGDGGSGASQALETRLLGYTPLAILTALALATPIAMGRKIRLLLIGYGLLLARLAAAIALPLERMTGGFDSGSFSGALAEIVWWSLINPPIMTYLPTLLIWWVLVAVSQPRAVIAR